jgi:hypothetical protein
MAAFLERETPVETSADLVPLRGLVVHDAFKPGGTDPIIDAIKRAVKDREKDLDVSTAKGRECIRKTAREIASAKVKIDDAGKEYVAQLKDLPRQVDAERRRLRDELDALRDEVRAPLTEYEQREAERVGRFETMIEQIERYGGYLPATSEQIAERIRQATECHADVSDWQEFARRAETTRADVLSRLNDALAATLKAEAEAAELARLRAEEAERQRAAREEQIRQEAAVRAKAEAEATVRAEATRLQEAVVAAERRAKEEAERADRIRTEGEERERLAALGAERDRVAAKERAERERQWAVKAERERIEAEQLAEQKAAEARQAKTRHRNKIHREIIAALVEHATLSQEQATAVAKALSEGAITHVEIRY